MKIHIHIFSLVMAVFLAAMFHSRALAGEPESGVSPTRVSLPQGPGSLEGVGENVQPNINMGLMSYPVRISLPDQLQLWLWSVCGWDGLVDEPARD
jgi:hypothetical protein